MKSAFKYILLTLAAAIVSIFIYEYITKSKNVPVEEDILTYQARIDSEIFSNTNYSVEDPKVILNPYGNSPLTAVVIFETKDLTSPTITVVGKDEESTITNTFLPSKKHILPIYGLYANTENKVIIDVSEKEKEITIKTGEVPNDLIEVENKDIQIKSNELYFVTSNYPTAFDSNGDLRWYLNTKYTWDISRLNNGHLLIGNNKLAKDPYYSSGLVELDLLGNIYYEYNTVGGYHHSVYEMNNGNLLLVSNNVESDTVNDFVVELDRATGKITKTFNFEKILNNLNSDDWLHIDSVWFDKKTNSVTVAGRNNNSIINIDYPSGEINYIIGNAPEKFKKYQISADIQRPLSVSNDNGNLLYYSNGKINEVKVNPNLTLENKFSYNVSNVSDLGVSKTNNGYLFSANNYIKEITEEKENLIEFNREVNNVKKMTLYANDMFVPSNGSRLGEIGVTKTTKNHTVIFYKDGTDIMKKYDIDIYKDALRLTVSGKFNKNDNVEIILDNVLDKKTYKMDIQEGTSSKYINEDSIKGKYYIYLRINGTIYKTYKCVTLY